jgi:cytochrome P450 / NADPH-cytochrome P450 reductase
VSEPLAPDDFPGPRGLPILGNVRAIDLAQPIESLMSLAREYGPIFKLTTPRGISVVVSGADLVSEICDDARFDKVITAGLSILDEGPVDAGLFTAETDDPMWARAHGILMAPFSMQAMRDYMPAMIDIADQLMGKWDRLNPGEEVDVPADMTRLTLDTIALCGFGYRFNSFYRETPHPFVQAMVRVLDESQARLRQPPIQTRVKISAQRQFEEDEAFMAGLVDDLIRKRRAMGEAADNTDLLGWMITGVDRQTGLTLPDENIRAQCLTFLIAGHETTSGLLSFAIYFLLEHPEYLDRARQAGAWTASNVRPAADRARARPRLGSDRQRRGDLRLRQCQHHGARRARGPDGDLPGENQRVRSLCRRVAPRTARHRPLPGGHLGGDGVCVVTS